MSNSKPLIKGLAIGGGMAFTFLKAMGHGVGRSLLEPDRLDAARAILERARARGIPLGCPVDVVAASGLDAVSGLRTVAIREIPDDLMGLDIGPATVTQFATRAPECRTIIWNGPMGGLREGAVRGGHPRRGAGGGGLRRVLGGRRRGHDRGGAAGGCDGPDRLRVHRGRRVPRVSRGPRAAGGWPRSTRRTDADPARGRELEDARYAGRRPRASPKPSVTGSSAPAGWRWWCAPPSPCCPRWPRC